MTTLRLGLKCASSASTHFFASFRSSSEIISLSTRVEVNHPDDVNTSAFAPETTSSAKEQPFKRATYNLPKLLYTNSRSIVSKIDKLDEIIKLNNFSLICITESWLTGNNPKSCVTLEDFTTYRDDRERRKGGGICA